MCWRSGNWPRRTARSAGASRSPTASGCSRLISALTPRARCSAIRAQLAPGARPTTARRSPCRAAIASPAAGISPAAAAMPAGWAHMAPSSSPTARCGSTSSAGRRSALGCFRPSRRPCSTIGTRSACAAPRPNPTRSRIYSYPRNSPAPAKTRPCAAIAANSTPSRSRRSIRSGSPASRSASPAACSTLLSISRCARPRAALAGSPTTP